MRRGRSRAASGPQRPRRIAPALALALAGVLALALTGTLPWHIGGGRASAAPVPGEVQPQTDASVPAQSVTMFGATPAEAGAPGPDDTWGIGSDGANPILVRYAAGVGWGLGPPLPAGFAPESSALTGSMTAKGSGALAGVESPKHGTTIEVLLTRSPGGGFAQTAPVPSEGEEALLHSGETLFGGSARSPMVAALDEESGGAGALVVPVRDGSGAENQVLHWDGSTWTSEPIAIPSASEADFRVLAIAASAPGNAWLLAQLASSSSYPPGSVGLFRRVEEGGHWRWIPVALSAGAGDGEAHPLALRAANGESRPLTVAAIGEPPTVNVQLLTVTADGVWVDGERGDIHARTPDSATLFFKPEGTAGGHVAGSWCVPPSEAGSTCEFGLPKPLPAGFDRSFAWPGEGFGQRVITGFPGGVSLRLVGDEFTPVLALGGGDGAEQTPGARFGAAFSSPSEGWLGVGGPPVHLTTTPEPSGLTTPTTQRLTPWSVPFRHPLLAIAPQPGAPVGSPSSAALAVGDLGAVARYVPSQGWLPESLFGPGGQVEKPRLRAVAWPTPNRAYAVGDLGHEIGEQMWLWRAETGLWEHDPAAPLNFTGNLLGIAFDPNNATRGYAVGTNTIGQGGVLLRYGKSWTPETALPPEVQQAEFVAIAFSGSEAIVAYREQPDPRENRFVGGLLVNDGSGWHVDQGAAAAMGAAVPEAVAGLPDGGAAFETSGGGTGPRVYERESATSPWTATATPLPGAAQGSLSLFREAGALRALVSGGGGVSDQLEAQPPPAGFPPNLVAPASPVNGSESGGLLRQTGGGWRDEGHELNPTGPQAGGYIREDIPYRPDPIFATLVEPGGTGGWAVGGNLNQEERVETGNLERYEANAEAVPSPRQQGGSIPTSTEAGAVSTFAFGGHAECAAPCAERAKAGIGPLVWLSAAAGLAKAIGVPFIYTGPSATQGLISGPRSLPIPFPEELEANVSALSSGPAGNTFVAPSPEDLNARPEREGSEQSFAAAFRSFPQASLTPEGASPAGCALAVGCEAEYYAFVSGGVEVVVLDDTGDVSATQLEWLERMLAEAAAGGRPAIVVGAADLGAQVAAGDVQAERVAAALTRPVAGASAYFYDAPEEDVEKELTYRGASTNSFGSGTLGYVQAVNERAGNFHGASGILLGQVNLSGYNRATNRAPVTARLIPVISELALEAKDGTLLRRSQPALFSGLARRPRAGTVSDTNNNEQRVDPYIPIPEECIGQCVGALKPEYTFTSSDEEKGMFVKRNTASPSPHAVLQSANGEPVFEHGAATSGLFCALNPGPVTITISAGGLSASLPIAIQPGSVRQPCGTTPLKQHPVSQQVSAPPPPPPPQPAPVSAAPASSPPPVPLPPPPLAAAPPARQLAPVPPPFLPLVAPTTPLLAFVPPPVPTPARPTPPSGTSAVTSPIEVAEKEEEQEEATESVSNQAVAYRASEQEPAAPFVIGLIVLAAFAGASIRRRPRTGRRGVHVAAATITTARSQRRLGRHDRRDR